jgi:hypothetical protein
MISANFPKKGAQAIRRDDGTVGDIYASDPKKDLLTVRWNTSTGVETRVCTSEMFARDWALTGTPTPEASFRKFGWILGLIVLVTIGAFWYDSQGDHFSPAGSSAANIPAPIGSRYDISIPPGTITLTAEQLETAYSYNAHKNGSYATIDAAADARYKGKMLLVSGFADDPSTGFGFQSALPFLNGVDISFRTSEKSKLANLQEGDSITVLCEGDGMAGTQANPIGNPGLKYCLLQERAPGISNAQLSHQIKTTILNSGIRINDYEYTSGLVGCHINTGDWLTFGPADIRNHLAEPLRVLYGAANKFPQIRMIDVWLETPVAEKDAHGHDLPTDMFSLVSFSIDAEDLRKYPKDFDWDSYPVYVINRYDHDVRNLTLEDTWKSELSDETRLGGFQVR